MNRTLLTTLLVSVACMGCPESDIPESEDTLYAPKPDTGTDSTPSNDIDTSTDTVNPGSTVSCGAPPQDPIFPSKELGVRITTPSGRSAGLVSGNKVQLAGNLFGDVASMTWSRTGNDGTQLDGEITPEFFWKTAPIPLVAGDNTLLVTAYNADKTLVVTDTIVVSTCPTLLGELQIQMTPDHVFVNEPRKLRATLRIDNPNIDLDPENIDLRIVDKNGEVAKPKLYKFTDSGEGCDPWKGDNIHSTCVTVQSEKPGRVWVRAHVKVGNLVCKSPIQAIDVVRRLTPAHCETMHESLKAARTAAQQNGAAQEQRTAALTNLSDNSATTFAAESGDKQGVWAKFEVGAYGALSMSAEGNRGQTGRIKGALENTNAVGNRRVLLLKGDDQESECDFLANQMGAECPPFDVNGPLQAQDASLDALRSVGNHAVFAFTGHGGVYFDHTNTTETPPSHWRHNGGQVVLWSGEPIQCSDFVEHSVQCKKTADCPNGSQCVQVTKDVDDGECVNNLQADVARGHVVMGDTAWGVTPSFIDHYAAGNTSKGMAYLGACSSLWNGSMAMAFLANGFSAYAGFTGPVTDAFAKAASQQFFEKLLVDKDTVGKAMCHANDVDNPGSLFALAGNQALTVNNPGILNPGFETPTTQGWTLKGDARRVASFCGANAKQGKYMGLISTGLNFTEFYGEFAQRLCIPEGAQTLSFWYKYYSAELDQSCNYPTGQDTWAVTVKKDGAPAFDLKKCSLNDMCFAGLPQCGIIPNQPCNPKTSTCPCGQCYSADLEQTPYSTTTACTFEGAAVKTSNQWQRLELPVGNVAGQGPITLRFWVTDKDSAAFDTAILIDDIEIN